MSVSPISPTNQNPVFFDSTPTVVRSDFESLTERLNPSEKSALLQKIEALENREKMVAQVIEIAQKRHYTEFFLDPQFEIYAFAALYDGLLTEMQFATLMFTRAALEENIPLDQMEAVPLFVDEAPSPQAWEILKENFKNSIPIDEFFEAMRKMPPSERFFNIIPDHRDLTNPYSNITVGINTQGIAFNTFSIIDNKKRMVPSFGMIKALLEVTGLDGFSYKLVVGSSTAENIRNSTVNENAREVCVHCPLTAPAPKMADGHEDTLPFDFMYHDIYHLVLCSHVPWDDRQFYGQLAVHFNPDTLKNPDPETIKIYQSYYDSMVDLEIQRYYSTTKKDSLNRLDERSVSGMEMTLDFIAPVRMGSDKKTPLIEQLNQKLKTLLSIKKIYFRDSNTIDEAVKFFETLSSLQQQQIGDDYFRIVNWYKSWPFVSPLEFSNLTPDEIHETARLIKLHDWGMTGLFRSGFSIKQILGVDPKIRELIVLQYVYFTFYIQNHNISFETLVSLEPHILERILKDYFPIIFFLEKGNTFSQVISHLQNETHVTLW